MGQREIEKRLKQYAAACEQIKPGNKELRIRELLQRRCLEEMKANASDVQTADMKEKITGGAFAQAADSDMVCIRRTRGTMVDFVLEQIGYLGRYCLIWQAAWIVLFCCMMRHGVPFLFGADHENAGLVTVSLLPPLLILLTVEEVTKVYQRSMLEIEYATKHSLRSAVMIRMLVLCVMHSFLVLICIICLHAGMESDMGQLLVYGFTPMVIMTAGLAKLMQYCQGELLRGAAVGMYLLMAVFAMIGNAGYFDGYQPAFFKIWCVVCAVGIVMVVSQFVCLNRKLSSYETIVQYID